jgi:hypothetical protein
VSLIDLRRGFLIWKSSGRSGCALLLWKLFLPCVGFVEKARKLEGLLTLAVVAAEPRLKGTFGIAASMLGLELSIEGPALRAA